MNFSLLCSEGSRNKYLIDLFSFELRAVSVFVSLTVLFSFTKIKNKSLGDWDTDS